MVQIAICDDENEAVTQHEDIVKSSLRFCGIGYEIITYTQSSHHGNQNMIQTHAPRRPPKRPGPIFLTKRLKRYATKCNTPKGAVLARKTLFHHGSLETSIYTARKKVTLRTSAAPRPKRRKSFPSWKKYRRRKKPRRPFKTPFGTPEAAPRGA